MLDALGKVHQQIRNMVKIKTQTKFNLLNYIKIKVKYQLYYHDRGWAIGQPNQQ